MINLHQRFNHYLNTNRKLDLQDINESVIAYGWTDNGKDLTGYYLLTKHHKLFYNLKEQFLYKESIGM
jgi:hypothetical protein